MSHIHLPDGALPGYIVFTGLMLTFALLVLATRKIRQLQLTEYMPRMAFVSAMLLIVMSIPLGILPVHANLSVLAGIMLGPWLAIFSAFVVNVFLSFVGHGTTAMVGINTLVLAAEMVLGYILLRGLTRYMSVRYAAVVAVVLTLALTTTAVLLSFQSFGVDVEALLHHNHDHGHEHGEPVSSTQDKHAHDHAYLWGLLAVLAAFIGPGVAVEAVLTFLLVGLFVRMRPGLLMLPTRSK